MVDRYIGEIKNESTTINIRNAGRFDKFEHNSI